MWEKKLKNSNCDKSRIVTKLKLWQNPNCDKTQVVTKLKLWIKPNCEEKNKNTQCDKTQIVTKLENSYYDKTQKLELWQNLKYDKSQFMKKTTLKGSFCKHMLTPRQPIICSLGSVLRFLQCFSTTF